MLNDATISLIVQATGVGLITLSTIPSIFHVGRKASKGKEVQYDVLYEDKDGVATSESQAQYSVKWPRIIVSIGAGLGLGCSIALSVFSTMHHLKANNVSGLSLAKDWATSFSWVSKYLDKSVDQTIPSDSYLFNSNYPHYPLQCC